MHTLIYCTIIVDETQVPPEDMDETYVEGFTHDEALQDQGLFKLWFHCEIIILQLQV